MLYLFVFTCIFIPLLRNQKSAQWTDFPAKAVPTFGRHALVQRLFLAENIRPVGMTHRLRVHEAAARDDFPSAAPRVQNGILGKRLRDAFATHRIRHESVVDGNQ